MVLKGGFRYIFALQKFKVKISRKNNNNNVVALADSPENGRSQQKLLLFSSPELMESYCGRLLPVDV